MYQETKFWLSIVICAFAGTSLAAESAVPLAQWKLDESKGPAAVDASSNTSDKILGFYRFVPGVLGNALQFDGYTTSLQRSWKQTPVISRGFSVEAWVALDAYPWNWVPLVDWARDGQAGYLFGIDAYGHFGLHAAVDGSWQVVTSRAKVPLKHWTHIAATFDPARGMALYLNGKKAGEMTLTGAFTPPEKTDLLIGRVREKMLPAPSGLIHPKHAVAYSLEGVIDELTIHGRALGEDELVAAFSRVRVPAGMLSPWAVMPSGLPGPGRFGAYYETLRFQDTWDRVRRIAPESDVVVRFPQSGMRLVFWQGHNYVPAWVTENGKWYTDEFMEAYGKAERNLTVVLCPLQSQPT